MDNKPTGLDMITEVPGMEKDEKPYVPEQVVDPDQVAIALAKRAAQAKQLAEVSALAVHAADTSNARLEQ